MSFPNIFLYMKYSRHPIHKQTLLLYSTIFRRWKSWAYKVKFFLKINSSRKFHPKSFFMMNFINFTFHPCPRGKIFFHVKTYFIHINLNYILHGKKMFQEYPFHVIKRFLKRFYHAHLLIFIPSHSHSPTHKIMSLQPY